LSSGDVTYETALLEVKFGNHSSSIVYNIIRTPSAPVILRLSWLERYNPYIDWKSQNLEFPVTPSLVERTSKPLTKKPLFIKPFFTGARAFIRAAKISTPFAIYVVPASGETTTSTNIPTQYKEFQDVFEKKNADILLEHRPYDCAIDLQNGAQPPFGPIYNLSQNELSALKDYIEENLAKNFIQHSKFPTGEQYSLLKRKMDLCGCTLIVVA
jgi:hypothetical protein